MPDSLHDKVAIVTGSSRGLGAGIALELARRGANLVITYNSCLVEALHVADQVTSLGREAVVVQAQGTDRDAPTAIVAAAVGRWGRIDIIVNNAGADADAALGALTHETSDKLLDTNARLPVFLVQAALPHLGRAPRVVSVSSIATRTPAAGMTAYAASKAALEAATRAWATEFGHVHGLTANCVNPGPVATDMWLRDTDPAVHDQWSERVRATPAAPRIASVDDVAQIVAFLCEERSRWITGSVVNANGGLVFV